MNDLNAAKERARHEAFSRRKVAFETGDAASAVDALLAELKPYRGRAIAGYMAMRTEIDPLPAMAEMARHGPVGVPVVQGRGLPLKFREWSPGCALVDGPLGARVPATGDWLDPEALIVPLVAFDRTGGRLGYGGGFYDRTLALLRARVLVLAIGFAWAAQEARALPRDATDQTLDRVVTERAVLRFGREGGEFAKR